MLEDRSSRENVRHLSRKGSSEKPVYPVFVSAGRKSSLFSDCSILGCGRPPRMDPNAYPTSAFFLRLLDKLLTGESWGTKIAPEAHQLPREPDLKIGGQITAWRSG